MKLKEMKQLRYLILEMIAEEDSRRPEDDQIDGDKMSIKEFIDGLNEYIELDIR